MAKPKSTNWNTPKKKESNKAARSAELTQEEEAVVSKADTAYNPTPKLDPKAPRDRSYTLQFNDFELDLLDQLKRHKGGNTSKKSLLSQYIRAGMRIDYKTMKEEQELYEF